MLAVILCGGENSRIPVIKGLIEIGGKTIVETQIDALGGIFDEIVISANSPEHYFRFGLPVIGDILPRRGPLTGILSVLLSTGRDGAFAVASDMPFIRPGLIRHIVENRGGAATVPVFGGMPEPLLAFYSKDIIAVGLKDLGAGNASLRELLGGIKVKYILEKEVRELDPEGRSFANINTARDLALLKDHITPGLCRAGGGKECSG